MSRSGPISVANTISCIATLHPHLRLLNNVSYTDVYLPKQSLGDIRCAKLI